LDGLALFVLQMPYKVPKMEEKINERITVRLPKETLLRMDSAMYMLGFTNRSEFVRVAVDEYIERRKTSPLFSVVSGTDRISVSLPGMASAALEYLIRMGYLRPEHVQDRFSEVVSEWIYKKVRQYEDKSPREVMEIVGELRKKGEESALKMADIVRE